MGATTTHYNFPYPLANDPVNVQQDIENLAQTVDTTLNTTFATKTYVDAEIGAATTSDISEGSNLYYTAERVQDELDNSLIAGTGLDKTYDDSAGTYTLDIDSTVVTTTGVQTISGKTLTSPTINGGTWNGSPIGITYGGTGQTTANAALNALLPSQTSASGLYLQSDGTNTSWNTVFDISTTQTLSNKTFLSPKEVISVVASAPSATTNLNVKTAGIFYYTSDATANWTLNIRGDASTTLDSLMSTGQSITVTFLSTQGITAYYTGGASNLLQIDGTTSGVTTKWQGGLTPTSGNFSGIDIYTYTIIKTNTATFTVLASQIRFA